MVHVNIPIPIITLKVNELNTPIKRQGLSGWIKKQDPTMLSNRDMFQIQSHKQFVSKIMEKDIQTVRAVMAIISGKIDFKKRNTFRDKEEHFVTNKNITF